MFNNTRFEGASLFSKEEIKISLENYSKEVLYWDARLKSEVTRIKDNNLYKLSLLQKISAGNFEGVLTNWKGTYKTYQKLVEQGYITFTDEEISRILNISVYKYPYNLGIWVDATLYYSISELYANGKDCYLNPNQAGFINKW